MSVLEMLQAGLGFSSQRARARTIHHPPMSAAMKQVRPRADGALVRAWQAQRSGEIETGHGALRYAAGRDWIIEHGGHEYSVVRGDIFEQLYRRVSGDRYAKRTDVVLRYFTLPYAARVQTLEGYQDAEPGDWIMHGVKGELWPVTPERGAAKYEPVD